MNGGETSQRLVSLDAFRGFTIAAMILVNNPGDWSNIYSQLGHAAWHGWTFTDWIFPFFLFICGVAMTLSTERRMAGGVQGLTLVKQLALRAGIIFLVGLLLNLIPSFNFSTLRIPGVLQRIALCILLAAPIVVFCGWRKQLAWIAALLATYSSVMLLVPVPDVLGRVAAGVLEPGRDVGAFLDRFLLDGHLWARSKTWDPEGLLSTLPALCSLLFGALTGRWLLAERSKEVQTVWMLLAWLALLWLGAILDVVLMPINKSLWTASYCIFMTGWALLVFAAFYWLADASGVGALRDKARRLMSPFTIYGMNALFIFALSGLIAKLLGYVKLSGADGAAISLKAWLYSPLAALPIGALNSSLLFALLFNGVMFLVAWFMWKRKWFIKV